MRLRLILSFSVVVLVAVLGVVVFVRLNTPGQVESYMYRGGAVGLENLVTTLENYYLKNNTWTGVNDIFTTLHGNPNGMGRGQGMGGLLSQHLRLADASGVVLVDTSGGSIGELLTASEQSQSITLTDKGGQIIGYLLPEGGNLLGTNDATPLIQRLNNAALQAGAIAAALALVLALILAYQILKPIDHLTRAAQEMSSGDLTQRVPEQGHDEIATLARSFNQMGDSLLRSMEQRRAMTADIAHELRTPLAVQRAQLEAMQDGIYPMTVENLQVALDQNRFLSHLVEDLRTLALADAGELRLDLEPVNLAELLENITNRFRPAAEATQVGLQFSTKEPALKPIIQADPIRLEQILINLIGNALRYTPDNGQILITLESIPSWAVITIQDSGPGISPEALEHLFERFYRADRSRSREAGGSGLGLTIAQQLANAHGGSISAENASNGGALFKLILPLPPT